MRTIVSSLFIIGCASTFARPANALQNSGSGLKPELVQGVLSTPDDELNTAFTPDGRTVYFSKNLGDRVGVILVTHWSGGKWSAPEVAPFSGQFSDYDPFVSPDGARLYWISNRPVDGKEKDDYDIWVVDKQGSGWGPPRHLEAPINTDAEEFYPTVAANGTLYFSSTRPGGKGRGGDIYRARAQGTGFGAPQTLGDSVNSATHEGDPYVAPDESFLVFAGYGREDGAGGGDLYVSVNRNGSWSAARHLGHDINSKAREYCPIGSPDGKWLYFTSFRGFIDSPRRRPLTMRELNAGIRTTLNGSGNVYRIPIAAMDSPAP
jgi:Tol biopolymer transport system component